MTFMPYRFYTIDTQAFLENDIGEYFSEERATEWFKGTLRKNVVDLRLRDLVPIEEWLCETPDAFPEWQLSRDRIWGSINEMMYDTDIPGVKSLFSSTWGYDEINFFLHPGFVKPTDAKSLAPADLVEYWCGGAGKAGI
ncbi:MAG: hypothetical protein GYA24_03880 [Candidatus Lokiarchaeota archaeon]|nr:hypothetical protein [Candidatus Lokiarchaeota archaeon]